MNFTFHYTTNTKFEQKISESKLIPGGLYIIDVEEPPEETIDSAKLCFATSTNTYKVISGGGSGGGSGGAEWGEEEW